MNTLLYDKFKIHRDFNKILRHCTVILFYENIFYGRISHDECEKYTCLQTGKKMRTLICNFNIRRFFAKFWYILCYCRSTMNP